MELEMELNHCSLTIKKPSGYFNELAAFNGDSDKSKYNYKYFRKMAFLQKEWNIEINDRYQDLIWNSNTTT